MALLLPAAAETKTANKPRGCSNACVLWHFYTVALRLFPRASAGKVLGPASHWRVHLRLELRRSSSCVSKIVKYKAWGLVVGDCFLQEEGL